MSSRNSKEKKIAEREHVMQMLYQMAALNDFSEAVYNSFMHLQMGEVEAGAYTKTLYDAFKAHHAEIDAMIEQFSNKWKTQRMPLVDLSILRLSITEICYMESIPTSVSINEAVNMAKKFSTEKSSSFINGVLGSVAKQKEEKEVEVEVEE